MATGYYSLSGVTVAGGGTTLVATQTAAPGGTPDASNFLNLIGADGTEGTPAGALIIGPAGQVGIVKHAVNATTLQLSKAWVGAAITGGAAEIILGINALPVGRLAALITQIVALRPLLKSSNLAEYAGDSAAQAAARANLGIADVISLLVDRAQSLDTTKQTQGRRNLGLTASGDLVSMAASVAAMRAALQITAAGEALLLATTAAIQRSALGANTPGSAIFTGATAAGQALATAADLAAQKTLLGIGDASQDLVTSGSISSSTANLELTLPSGYKSFRLVLRNHRPAVDGGYLSLQVKKGGAWKTAGGDYIWNQTYWTTGSFTRWDSVSNGTTNLMILTGFTGLAAATSGLTILEIEPGDGTFVTSVMSRTMRATSGAAGNAGTAAAGRAEALRVLYSSGNIGNLQYELYGLKG